MFSGLGIEFPSMQVNLLYLQAALDIAYVNAEIPLLSTPPLSEWLTHCSIHVL